MPEARPHPRPLAGSAGRLAGRPPRSPAIVRLLGLAAPVLGAVLVLAGVAVFEQLTHLPSRLLGHLLLITNAHRSTTGEAWDSIMAGRKARERLHQAGAADTTGTAIPAPVVANAYALQRRSGNAATLSVSPRQTPLRLDTLGRQQLGELASSLLAYRSGHELMQAMSLPARPLMAHARAQAAAALEDGTLFAALHRQLSAGRRRAAGDFTQMSAGDEAYWKGLLEPVLAAPDTARPVRTGEPGVDAALQELLQESAAEQRQVQTERVQRAWEEGPYCQIRVASGYGGVSGQILTQDGRAVQFELPGASLRQVLQARLEKRQ